MGPICAQWFRPAPTLLLCAWRLPRSPLCIWREGASDRYQAISLGGSLALYHDLAEERWHLFHSATGEMLVLERPAGEWLLDMEDDQEPYLVDCREGDCHRQVAAFDLLQLRPHRHCSDGRFAVKMAPPESGMLWLSELQAWTYPRTMSLRADIGGVEDILTFFTFRVPRDGFLVYWSVPQVLTLMGIERSSKAENRYCSRQWSSWGRAASLHGMQGLLSSLPYDQRTASAAADASSRPLETKTCSSGVLVLLLARWTFCNKQSGGMGSHRDRLSAQSLLQRLLRTAYEASGCTLTLFAGGDAERLPFGAIVGAGKFTIEISTDGSCDFSSLLDVCRHAFASAPVWLRWLEKVAGSDNLCIVGLLQWCVCDGSSRAAARMLSSQVIWPLGIAIDRCAASVSQQQLSEYDGGSIAKAAMEVRKRVAHYVHACSEVVSRGDTRLLSGCVDKSRVASYGMLSGCYCLTDNTCFWGVPQDFLGRKGLRIRLPPPPPSRARSLARHFTRLGHTLRTPDTFVNFWGVTPSTSRVFERNFSRGRITRLGSPPPRGGGSGPVWHFRHF